jgi:predicted transcriptional regulator
MSPKQKPEEKTTVQTVRLDSAMHKRLGHFAVDSGMSNQEILYAALVEYLKKNKA